MTTELNKENSLVVSECFYSIQGEGKTMGIPAVFLRLAGCNLLCKSESWICDSIEVWQQGSKIAFPDVLSNEKINHLRDGAHLVITGGEPLLHQKSLILFIEQLDQRFPDNPFFIEIETNGTIIPLREMLSRVDQWNCSPKLKNSGEPYNKRFKDLALMHLNGEKSTIFKFVIQEENDLVDLFQEFGNKVDNDKIWLMPAGCSRKELDQTRELVAEACKVYGFRYSELLHIVIWDKKTGV